MGDVVGRPPSVYPLGHALNPVQQAAQPVQEAPAPAGAPAGPEESPETVTPVSETPEASVGGV